MMMNYFTFQNKRNVTDFALWKASKDGEPYWNSPWGKGKNLKILMHLNTFSYVYFNTRNAFITI